MQQTYGVLGKWKCCQMQIHWEWKSCSHMRIQSGRMQAHALENDGRAEHAWEGKGRWDVRGGGVLTSMIPNVWPNKVIKVLGLMAA
eukprot:359853-Chlamydomonas_euryale.AAC.20